MYFDRWPVDDVYDQVAENVASMVESGSCIGFTIGPLYEALGKHLSRKRDLGVHSPTFTDALMDLVKSGAVSNRKKGIFKGKCLASYAVGTEELMQWLHRNPLVEFQGIDVVANPGMIGLNDNYVSIYPARKVDLTGRIALHAGRGSVSASPGESFEFYIGASFSKNGKTIYALPSRNLERKSNILLSVEEYPNQFTVRESLDYIITEYGVASLKGRTIRERALLLIDIAHPDDREALVDQAKEANLLYPDQIYLTDSGRLYPKEIECSHTFSGDLVIRFRPIKPSDEDEMRKLFTGFQTRACTIGISAGSRPCRTPKCNNTSTSTTARPCRSWGSWAGPVPGASSRKPVTSVWTTVPLRTWPWSWTTNSKGGESPPSYSRCSSAWPRSEESEALLRTSSRRTRRS